MLGDEWRTLSKKIFGERSKPLDKPTEMWYNVSVKRGRQAESPDNKVRNPLCCGRSALKLKKIFKTLLTNFKIYGIM